MRLTNSKLKLNENISDCRLNRKVKLDYSCENHSKLVSLQLWPGELNTSYIF